MKCEHKVMTDMTAGRVKVQKETQLTTPNPLLSHSYLHEHCNTSHTELTTSNIYVPFRGSHRILFPPLADTLPASASPPPPRQKQIERNYCTNKYGMHRRAGPQRLYRPTEH